MLKELTKADWLKILALPEPRVPSVLIVRGTRNFRARYRAMRPCFDDVLDLGTPNGILEDVLVGDSATAARCRPRPCWPSGRRRR